MTRNLNDQTTHPAPPRLERFARGELDLKEIDEIQQHLAICDSCCHALEQIPDDSFLGLVRQAKPTFEHVVDNDGDANPTETALDVQDQTVFPPNDRATCEVPPELAGHPRYRILAKIGKGGMGDVYKAEHRLMHRTVALKVINHVLVNNPQAIERFRREVQAAASLTHPNIVSAYDAGQAGRAHFLAMEYVEGTDLAGIVKQRGPMSSEDACRLVRQAALGLDTAHQQGMIHRDIKPHNLMLATDGTLKILDFGLASLTADPVVGKGRKFLRGDLTTHSTVIGTPDYVAPEQADDAHGVDLRADIYGLGATFYFLLAGQPPFDDVAIKKWLEGNSRCEPQPIESLRGDLPEGLATVIHRMMAQDPNDRYERAMDVVHALEPYLAQSGKTGDIWEARPRDEKRRRDSGRSVSLAKWRMIAVTLVLVCSVVIAFLVVLKARTSGKPPQTRNPQAHTQAQTNQDLLDSSVEPTSISVAELSNTEYHATRIAASDQVTAVLDHEFAFDFRGGKFDSGVFIPLGINSLYGASLIKPESRGLRITIPKSQISTKQQMGFAPALEIHGDFDIAASYEILLTEANVTKPGTGPNLYLTCQGTRHSAGLRRTELRTRK